MVTRDGHKAVRTKQEYCDCPKARQDFERIEIMTRRSSSLMRFLILTLAAVPMALPRPLRFVAKTTGACALRRHVQLRLLHKTLQPN